MITESCIFLILCLVSIVPAQQLSVGGKCLDFRPSQYTEDENVFKIPGHFIRHGKYNQTWVPLRFHDKPTSCNGTTSQIFTVSWNSTEDHPHIDSGQSPEFRSFLFVENASISIPIHFSRDGMFFNGTHYFPKENYCVETFGNRSLTLRLCSPPPQSDIFLPKCCSMDEFILAKRTCTPLNSTQHRWKPDLYPESNFRGPRLQYKDKHIQYYVKDITATCRAVESPSRPLIGWWSPTGLGTKDITRVKLVARENGAVYPVVFENRTRKWVSKASTDFCVEAAFTATGAGKKRTYKYQGNSDDFVVYYCPSEKFFGNISQQLVKSWVHAISISVSCLFLVATVTVYLLLLKEHHLHGLLVLSYSVAMLGRNIFAAWAYFISMFPKPDHFGVSSRGWPCVTIAVIGHYFEVASYTGMTVLNLDMLLTLRSTQIAANKGRQMGNFLGYMMLAWVVPILLVGAFLGVDIVYRDPYTEVPVPGYGDKACYVARPFRGYYVFAPMGITIGVNFFLIVVLLYTLYKAYRQNKTFRQGDSAKASGPSLWAWLVVKVFVVMGSSELIGYITWFFYEPTPKREKAIWLVVVEAVYHLLPVVLFFLFCGSTRITRHIRNKFK